jgi:hypothetical protein
MVASENGKHLLAGLKETRNFLGQVSLLMRTLDGQLAENGWVNALKANPKTAVELSSDIYQPQAWMPRRVSRLYVNPDAKNILAFAGVLLDVETEWAGFDQPWLTCGLFKAMPDKTLLDSPTIGLVEAHLIDEHDADGKFTRFTWKKADVGEDGEYYRSTMALPLVDFQNTDDLLAKITNPLLEEVKAAASVKPG